jgi:hypothetical protein
MWKSFSNAELLLEEIRLSNIKPKNKGKEIFLGYSLVKTDIINAIENYFDSREKRLEHNENILP